jgi:hypothetical protein
MFRGYSLSKTVYRGRDLVLETVLEIENPRLCIGCKREAYCEHNIDLCISQHLFVLAVGWAEDPTVIERIEGRFMDPLKDLQGLPGPLKE